MAVRLQPEIPSWRAQPASVSITSSAGSRTNAQTRPAPSTRSLVRMGACLRRGWDGWSGVAECLPQPLRAVQCAAAAVVGDLRAAGEAVGHGEVFFVGAAQRRQQAWLAVGYGHLVVV